MDKLTHILNRIEKARPESERSLVQEFLNELAQGFSSKGKQFLRKAADNLLDSFQLWPSVKNFLEGLIANPSQFDLVPSHLREEFLGMLKKFSNLATMRTQEISRISPHIMNLKAERLYFKLSKISLEELTKRLQKLWNNFRDKNFSKLFVPDERLGIKFSPIDTYILLETIQHIHTVLAAAELAPDLNRSRIYKILLEYFIEYPVSPGRLRAFRISLEALEAMAYVHHQIENNPTASTNIEYFPFHDFVHCSKCWRLVPICHMNEEPHDSTKAYHKNKTAPYCDEHMHTSSRPETQTEYRKALALSCNNKKERFDQFLPQKTLEILKKCPSIAPDAPDGLSAQEWYDARRTPMQTLDLKKYPRIEFDLDWIWELCPNVLRYINEKGGDPHSPESVIEKLDPFTQREEEEGKELRIKLHELLAKNFGLYLPEIAMAETYLSKYNKIWDGRTHGGNRRGKK